MLRIVAPLIDAPPDSLAEARADAAAALAAALPAATTPVAPGSKATVAACEVRHAGRKAPLLYGAAADGPLLLQAARGPLRGAAGEAALSLLRASKSRFVGGLLENNGSFRAARRGRGGGAAQWLCGADGAPQRAAAVAEAAKEEDGSPSTLVVAVDSKGKAAAELTLPARIESAARAHAYRAPVGALLTRYAPLVGRVTAAAAAAAAEKSSAVAVAPLLCAAGVSADAARVDRGAAEVALTAAAVVSLEAALAVYSRGATAIQRVGRGAAARQGVRRMEAGALAIQSAQRRVAAAAEAGRRAAAVQERRLVAARVQRRTSVRAAATVQRRWRRCFDRLRPAVLLVQAAARGGRRARNGSGARAYVSAPPRRKRPPCVCSGRRGRRRRGATCRRGARAR